MCTNLSNESIISQITYFPASTCVRMCVIHTEVAHFQASHNKDIIIENFVIKNVNKN